jgi:2-C-methyl-D-erythritol 2,4-cyclodiphosphate synthase
VRIGFGYDIHRFDNERPLVLGGVRIRERRGLLGHSDADVLLHSIMDALLGAACLGDIGQHFPPSDPAFRGAPSIDLLGTVIGLVAEAGYRAVNVDSTLVAEEPRIGPYIAAMQGAIAPVLNVAQRDVSIKATTNEGVGPEGRGEAMSAYAVVLLEDVR